MNVVILLNDHIGVKVVWAHRPVVGLPGLIAHGVSPLLWNSFNSRTPNIFHCWVYNQPSPNIEKYLFYHCQINRWNTFHVQFYIVSGFQSCRSNSV